MAFKAKIKCPVYKGGAKISKTSLRLFNGLITLKDTPIYECIKCKEKFATGKMVDENLKAARKEFSFNRQLI